MESDTDDSLGNAKVSTTWVGTEGNRDTFSQVAGHNPEAPIADSCLIGSLMTSISFSNITKSWRRGLAVNYRRIPQITTGITLITVILLPVG